MLQRDVLVRVILCSTVGAAATAQPVKVGFFDQQVRQFYSTAHGLPSNDVLDVFIGEGGRLYARTAAGGAVFKAGRWHAVSILPQARRVRKPPAERFPDANASAVAADGSIWYATKTGAWHAYGSVVEYRQGLRWLPHDEVRAIATVNNDAWFATRDGIGIIRAHQIRLADKARRFEADIEKRHRRTQYGYVDAVRVSVPGDASEWTQRDSDNDGLWTSMYGAGEAFACAATDSGAACERAKAAFEALRFLGKVTEGGKNPAPRGYVARTILPTSGRDPNIADSPERDEKIRSTRERLWKVMRPRWPVSADGKWYWKSDTSSDELDGHYFFYGAYYDLVAKTDAERERVRRHVAAMTDHLVNNNFQLIDHDGRPTRWGIFNPENLNRNVDYWEERGLNSISILAYLTTAEHITGDAKYAAAARMLIEKHAYDMNTLIPKSHGGPGSGNQSDDEMAFMCLYNLMKYEKDVRLRMIYGRALRNRWEIEASELNPLFNFIAAAGLSGVEFADAYRRQPLALTGPWRDESVDTLRRYPLDRFNWPMKNSGRGDIARLSAFTGGRPGTRGHRANGRVLPIDERYVDHWNHDPWQLDYAGDGRTLADGASFLLPYYMGLYHKFIAD
jgi:hypothetical protein